MLSNLVVHSDPKTAGWRRYKEPAADLYPLPWMDPNGKALVNLTGSTVEPLRIAPYDA